MSVVLGTERWEREAVGMKGSMVRMTVTVRTDVGVDVDGRWAVGGAVGVHEWEGRGRAIGRGPRGELKVRKGRDWFERKRVLSECLIHSTGVIRMQCCCLLHECNGEYVAVSREELGKSDLSVNWTIINTAILPLYA